MWTLTYGYIGMMTHNFSTLTQQSWFLNNFVRNVIQLFYILLLSGLSIGMRYSDFDYTFLSNLQ